MGSFVGTAVGGGLVGAEVEVEVGREVALGCAVGPSVGGSSVTVGASWVGTTVGCSGAANVDETVNVAARFAFA